MPYPKNVETALEVEKVVRENGAIPAQITATFVFPNSSRSAEISIVVSAPL